MRDIPRWARRLSAPTIGFWGGGGQKPRRSERRSSSRQGISPGHCAQCLREAPGSFADGTFVGLGNSRLFPGPAGDARVLPDVVAAFECPDGCGPEIKKSSRSPRPTRRSECSMRKQDVGWSPRVAPPIVEMRANSRRPASAGRGGNGTVRGPALGYSDTFAREDEEMVLRS